MNYITKRFLLLVVIFSTMFIFGAAGQAEAQEPSEKLPPSIRTSGEAVVTVQPNRAQIEIGVVTQADASQAAVAQNAQKLEAALAKLRSVLGPAADIKTISYNVSPNYRYPKEGGEPTIAGYTATNVVRVTLDDLTKVGTVIDAATQAGSNRIQNLRFLLKDESAAQAQALRDAATQARAKAQALAAALNLTITRVLSVAESGSPAYPMREVAFAKADAASTPIEPGMIEVRASVTLTVQVEQ